MLHLVPSAPEVKWDPCCTNFLVAPLCLCDQSSCTNAAASVVLMLRNIIVYNDIWMCLPFHYVQPQSVAEHVAHNVRHPHVLSGVVVLSGDVPLGAALLFLRGAPRVIRRLVDPATIPHNFEEVCFMMQSDAVL